MKKFEKLLNKEFEKITPTQSERLRHTRINAVEEKTEINEKKTFFKKRYFLSALCSAFACILLFVGVFNIFIKGTPTANASDYTSYITVSINPQVSISVDKKGNVENIVADNYDGEVLLYNLNLNGTNYDSAIETLFSKAKELGYIDKSAGINVNVTCFKGNKIYKDIEEKIKGKIEPIINQTKPFEINEKQCRDLLEEAKLLDFEIDDDSDDFDIIKAMKGKRSFKNEKGEDLANNQEFISLSILENVLSTYEKMYDILSDISELAEDNSLNISELFFTTDFEIIKELLQEVSEYEFLSQRIGEKITLNVDNFDSELNRISQIFDEEDCELIEDVLDDIKDGEEISEEIKLQIEQIMENYQTECELVKTMFENFEGADKIFAMENIEKLPPDRWFDENGFGGGGNGHHGPNGPTGGGEPKFPPM